MVKSENPAKMLAVLPQRRVYVVCLRFVEAEPNRSYYRTLKTKTKRISFIKGTFIKLIQWLKKQTETMNYNNNKYNQRI